MTDGIVATVSASAISALRYGGLAMTPDPKFADALRTLYSPDCFLSSHRMSDLGQIDNVYMTMGGCGREIPSTTGTLISWSWMGTRCVTRGNCASSRRSAVEATPTIRRRC